MEIQTNESSKKYQLNKEDGIKILKGALISIGSVLLTYTAEIIPKIDFKEFTPLVIVISGVLINGTRKLLQGK